MENKESVNSSLDQIVTGIDKLSIEGLSDRKNRVKFLINVPVGVTPVMSANEESHCQRFLDLLKTQAFRTEDELFYEDIAVVFGLNGKYEDEEIVKTELKKTVTSKITFKKWGFTWPEKEKIPYRLIREEIKRSEHTKELVKNFREKSPGVPIYFCFFDADTDDFNEVLSSYIDIIIEHNYPTVMSTGYLFPRESEFRTKSERDRQVRIITAKHYPLGTYYPEPNFCVRLPDECDTLPEHFTKTTSKHMNMESAVLIRQIKLRPGFSAVFADKNPIITPESRQKHFHTKPWTWAISAYTHGELKVTEAYKLRRFGEKFKNDRRVANGLHKSLLMDILKSDEGATSDVITRLNGPLSDAISLFGWVRRGLLDLLVKLQMKERDEEAERIEEENPFEGNGAGQVFKAARAVQEYFNGPEPEDPEEQEDPEDPEEQENPDNCSSLVINKIDC